MRYVRRVSHDGIVDLRSDTVTRPTDAMRKAMAEADVGDDGYGEDPTVLALQERFAERVGKEAALFVPSGTMANQIAVRVLAEPGTSIVVGRRQHVVVYEMGAAAVNSRAQFHLVDDERGVVTPADVEVAIAAADHHWIRPSCVFVENTHMPSGGTPWPVGAMADLAAVGLPIHLDGARLFNAEVATGHSAWEYAKSSATVMCCLSKGLGAPVGSVLAGPADLMIEAWIERKRLGGSMRQAGIIAAAGLVALDSMIERLADDHERARRIAVAVADRYPDAGLDPAGVMTNVVVFRHSDPPALLAHLRDQGILGGTIEPGVVRLMTHIDVDDDDVARVERALADAG
jgi:threonine aldolase